MALETKSIKLGIFVLLGTVLLMVGIFFIGSKDALFTKTIKISAYFSNIEGLRKGAPARLSGINVGSVSEIKIASDNTGRVEVFLSLDREIKRLIRLDSHAYVETEGLVGNKVVIISLGSPEKPEVNEGDRIIGVDPFGLGAILSEFKGALENTKGITKDFADIVHKVNSGNGSIGKLINDPDLFNSTTNLLKTADKGLSGVTRKFDSLATIVTSLGAGVSNVLKDISGVTADLDTVILNIKEGKGLLGSLLSKRTDIDTSVSSILANLVSISEEVKTGSSKFSENMEALKRNWLFSSYFEQRGYYDKQAYEKQLDEYIQQINSRIKVLDEKIQVMKDLKKNEK